MVNKRYLSLITFLADVTQKILSHPLSLSSPAITFHTSERPWCRTFARPLLLNHRANSPHKPTATIPASSAITAAPSTDKSDVSVPSSHRGGLERVATPQHPPAAPCTFGRGCPSSCCAHQPRALFCRAFPLNLVSRSHTSPSHLSCVRSSSDRLSAPHVEAACPPRDGHTQAHNNQRCACLFRICCFYVAFACYFDLICLTVFWCVDVDLLHEGEFVRHFSC